MKTREWEDRTESDISPVTVNHCWLIKDRGDPTLTKPIKSQKERGDTLLRERGDTLFADSGRASSEILEWLQEFREKFGGWWNSRTWGLSRQFFSRSIFKSAYSRDMWILVSTMITLISLKNEIARSAKGLKLQGPMQKTQWWSRTSCRKFWWFDNSRSQLSDKCESRNNHQCAVVAQDLATQWIQASPWKTKKLHRKPKGACKSSWSRRWSLKSLTKIFLGNRQGLWWSFLESLQVYATQIGDFTEFQKEQCAAKKRYLCCIDAIRSEWKLVGRLYGMLYLSAKRSRSFIWWEDALWKTFWATMSGTDYSIWFTGWVSPYFCEGPVKNPLIRKECLT